MIPPAPRTGPVTSAAYKAVNDAYYPAAVAAPSAARARAQAAYTIAAAVATALVTAGLLTGIQSKPTIVKIVGVAAVGSWILVSLLFMWAVGVDVKTPRVEYLDPDTWVSHVFADLKAEVKSINDWIVRAFLATIAASILTILAFVLGLAVSTDVETTDATVALKPAVVATLKELCDKQTANSVRGSLDISSLAKGFVKLTVPGASCSGRAGSGTVVLLLPMGQIAGVATTKQEPVGKS